MHVYNAPRITCLQGPHMPCLYENTGTISSFHVSPVPHSTTQVKSILFPSTWRWSFEIRDSIKYISFSTKRVDLITSVFHAELQNIHAPNHFSFQSKANGVGHNISVTNCSETSDCNFIVQYHKVSPAIFNGVCDMQKHQMAKKII